MTTTAPGGLIDGFAFRDDRAYDPETGMWVLALGEGVYRVGINALSADAYGALAQLVVDNIGTVVHRGEAFGSLEAAKFVGPLIAPISGLLRVANRVVADDPDLVLRSPYDAGWLVEITAPSPSEVEDLLTGEKARAWFAETVAEHRRNGLVAE